MRKIGFAILLSGLWFAVGCGGNGGGSSPNNNNNSASTKAQGVYYGTTSLGQPLKVLFFQTISCMRCTGLLAAVLFWYTV